MEGGGCSSGARILFVLLNAEGGDRQADNKNSTEDGSAGAG